VPLIGGWIANHHWGERRCILAGGLLLILGQFLLTGPSLLPWIAAQAAGVDVRSTWEAAGLRLGALTLAPEAGAALAAAADAAGVSPETAARVYALTGVTFFCGLACIVAGTAFIKPTISSIIGRFFQDGDRRRDGAFSIFFVGIYIGSLSASLIAGYLGERIAWHWGFSAAGFGMAIGMLAYLWKQHAWLGNVGLERVGRRTGAGAGHSLSPEERDRIKVTFVQGLFTIAYAAAFFQKGGLLTLFANENMNRELGGWTIPTTWFLIVSTATFIVVTPLAARYWQALAARGRNPSASLKLAWGLMALGVGYLVLICGMAVTAGDQKTWWGWLVLTYVCFGVGDTLVWPNQISLVTKLAPVHLSALFVGGWYVTIGIGSWITGYIGALAWIWDMRSVFLLLAAAMFALGALLRQLTPGLIRRMHAAE
jgi:POT family proton-dependent oligopeptide transporter